MNTAKDYRYFITREFDARVSRNSSYSLRAFARDLNVPAPKLSQVLNGKCGISVRRGGEIADHLALTEKERELFLLLIEYQHSRSQLRRKQAKSEINRRQKSSRFESFDLQTFSIFRNWYHFAILELTEISTFIPTAGWISKRLEITTRQAQGALDHLLKFGLLKKEKKKLVQTHENLATPSEIPSIDIREHHAQILNKALKKLDQSDISERDFSAVQMAIDSSDIDEAKKWIKEFRRKFCNKLQKADQKDRVYCLAIQFFPLDSKEPDL